MSAIQTYFQDFLTNIRLPDNLKKALISAHTELREQLKSDDLTKDLLVEIFCENWQNPVKQRITPHFLTTSPSNYYEFTTKE